MTRFVYFTHSLQSCWNHGNAHFLRGVLSDLVARGHAVRAYEPVQAWSVQNLCADAGEAALGGWCTAYPTLSAATYARDGDLAALVDGADVVIVHEWNEPALVAGIGALRRAGGRFTLLFHDTHHRAVSDPDAMRQYDLSGYDGVLAFGETLSEIYRGWGWGDRVFTWHEAADTRMFHPPDLPADKSGAVWIGNWGDGERTAEIESFLLRPTYAAGLPLDIYGVRYPDEARLMLDRHGVRGGSTRQRCRVSRRSGYSRRWRAASRLSRRHGKTAKACFHQVPTTSSPPMAPRWSATSATWCMTRRCGTALPTAASRPFAPVIPARIGSMR